MEEGVVVEQTVTGSPSPITMKDLICDDIDISSGHSGANDPTPTDLVGATAAGSSDDFDLPFPPIHSPADPIPMMGPVNATDIIEENTDIEKDSEPGVCGLRNIGNTCFMNSGLQCLLSNTALRHHFLEGGYKNHGNQPTLANSFYLLMSKIWSGKFAVIKPVDFKEALAQYHHQFCDYRQHDCQEFIALLLSSLHEEIRARGLNMEPVSSPMDDVPSKHLSPRRSHDVDDSDEDDTDETADVIAMEALNFTAESLAPSDDAAAVSKIPLIDAFYSKDTKTLNTNVQSEDEPDEGQVVDSDKFTKQEGVKFQLTMHNLIPGAQSGPAEPSTPPALPPATAADVAPSPLSNNQKQIAPKSNLQRPASGPSAPAVKNAPNVKEGVKIPLPPGDVSKSDLENIKRIKIDDALFYAKNSNLIIEKIGGPHQLSSPSQPSPTNHNLFDRRSEEFDKVWRVSANNLFAEAKSMKQGGRLDVHNELELDKFRNEKSEKLVNLQYDLLNTAVEKDGVSPRPSTPGHVTSPRASQGAVCRPLCDPDSVIEAEKRWAEYKTDNDSVISDSFHGQFRNEIVCAACGHMSVTFEPFMYLSVPLPHAMERQIPVVHVPWDLVNEQPVRYLVTVSKTGTVKDIRIKLQTTISQESSDPTSNLTMALVAKHKIVRLLTESMQLKYMTDPTQTVYAYSMPVTLVTHVIPDGSGDVANPSNNNIDTLQGREMAVQEAVSQWSNCAICLEEMLDNELLVHASCGGTLCNTCLEASMKHFGDSCLLCPICSSAINMTNDFTPLKDGATEEIRAMNVFVLSRCDHKQVPSEKPSLFGVPRLMFLPSTVDGAELYNRVKDLAPAPGFEITITDAQGFYCSRCIKPTPCRCEESSTEGTINLRPGDTLTLVYDELPPSPSPLPGGQQTVVDHNSMRSLRHTDDLTLQDCISSFTAGEVLDVKNPWYCPSCKANQIAKKTMSIWRQPQNLIVHLKRFQYEDSVGCKLDNTVEFPCQDLDISPLVTGPFFAKPAQLIYDLHGCVCHFGGLNFGHYTSYSLNADTGRWYYFNDETVTERSPGSQDSKDIYVLFYQRKDCSPVKLVADNRCIVTEETASSATSCLQNASGTNIPSCSSMDID